MKKLYGIIFVVNFIAFAIHVDHQASKSITKKGDGDLPTKTWLSRHSTNSHGRNFQQKWNCLCVYCWFRIITSNRIGQYQKIRPDRGIIIVAYFSILIKESDFLTGIKWLFYRSIMSMNWLELKPFVDCILIKTQCLRGFVLEFLFTNGVHFGAFSVHVGAFRTQRNC